MLSKTWVTMGVYIYIDYSTPSGTGHSYLTLLFCHFLSMYRTSGFGTTWDVISTVLATGELY